MSDRIDLKEIERRAYLSYHEDRLVDILVGICLFIASLYAYVEMIWLAGSMVAVMTPMYMVMNKKCARAVGCIAELTRFNRYAAATLVVMGSANFIPTPFIAHMVLLSVIIMVSGYLQVQSFKRKYPIFQEI